MNSQKCNIAGCENKAEAKVTWIGQVKWTGRLCNACLAGMWEQHRGLVALQKADIIIEQIKG